ncbi:uncharacterized protein LOC132300827 [Cornus florida]|uniref:uncharacterized protein LOC132300827 n=1 Tax=Cornus florida TaxID=4283 RepID=UPI002899414B|nr:uncharacterized protein LOC132300827 [Cornus florida]
MKRRATTNLELELHGGLSQGSNSQSHTSHGSQEEDVGTTESNELITPKKTRGPTRCANVVQHDTKKNGLIPLSVNEHGQPNGADEKNFANYLGTIARNGLATPLNYKNWRKVPEIVKEDMWTTVRGKFAVEEISKDWTLSSLGHKWRDWKSEIKSNYYKIWRTDKQRYANPPPSVEEDQWDYLIRYWRIEAAQVIHNVI